MADPGLIDVIGAILSIGGKEDDTEGGPPEEGWLVVGELVSFGEITFAANQLRNEAIGRIHDVVHKGVEPMPSVPVGFNKISGGDEGQDAMLEAQRDRTRNQWYWFKLALPDLPDNEGEAEGTTATFKAKVTAFTPLGALGVSGFATGGAVLVIDPDTFEEHEPIPSPPPGP